jgi:hypothetical protein
MQIESRVLKLPLTIEALDATNLPGSLSLLGVSGRRPSTLDSAVVHQIWRLELP